MITEENGQKRIFTLRHNRTPGDSSVGQPRFLEEEDATWITYIDPLNRMTRDNYHNLLNGLSIPARGSPEEYDIEQIFYIRNRRHRVIVEHTQLILPPEYHHRSIKRQKLPREGTVFPNYKKLIEHLDQGEIIFAEDFKHWKPQPPPRAEKEMTTRINAPRK